MTLSRLSREINYMEQEWYRVGCMRDPRRRYQGVRPVTAKQRRRIVHKANRRLRRRVDRKLDDILRAG